MFTTSKEAIEWIESIKKFGSKLDLSRMQYACEQLNHPERSILTIHIAGTNGKGSTVSFLQSMLMASGYTVGTFTSPYIVSFNERISINKVPISDEDLLYYINQIYELYQTTLNTKGWVITFFECVTLISFLYFKETQPDIVIYEVGLGGTLDATNVITPLVSGITSISYDHMGVLGNTLESIARNKLGIVKTGVPLITTVDQPSLLPLFKDVAKEKDAPYKHIDVDDIEIHSYANETHFTYQNTHYVSGLNGIHQPKNAVLAIELLRRLEQDRHISTIHDAMVEGIKQTFWPGRLERFGNILLDGAHNIGGMDALVQTIKHWQLKTCHVLLTAMADKETDVLIKTIEPIATSITFTQFPYPRCETASRLYSLSTHEHKHQDSDAQHALKTLICKHPNDIILITGSLYFVSYMRPIVQSIIE